MGCIDISLIGAVIMVHGDNDGLVLPPYIAPIQVVIIPIQQQKPGVLEASEKLYNELRAKGFRVNLMTQNKSPGWKFSEYEMKGVPLRIEVGPRDLEQGHVQIVERLTRKNS